MADVLVRVGELLGGPLDGARVRRTAGEFPALIYVRPGVLEYFYFAWSRKQSAAFPHRYRYATWDESLSYFQWEP